MSSSDISEFDLPAEHESKLSAASRAISDGDLSENKEEEVVVEEEETNKRNSLRLTKAETGHLGLNLGCNSAVFSVTTRFQGTYKASCNIHLWRQRDRIVISDIDGTITRSDVRGMLLPLIGASNWAQGEVVRLYNLIADNGYRLRIVMLLSSYFPFFDFIFPLKDSLPFCSFYQPSSRHKVLLGAVEARWSLSPSWAALSKPEVSVAGW